VFDISYQTSTARRRVFHVAGTQCVLGRARSADLFIDSRSVAKRHAEFTQHADGVYVRDLGTPTGTYVNRQRVVEYGPIETLDEVLVGDVKIELQKVLLNETASTGLFNDSNSPTGKDSIASSFSESGEPIVSEFVDVTNRVEHIYVTAYWGRVIHERLIEAMDLRRKDVSRMSDEQLRHESAALISDIIEGLAGELPESVNLEALHQHVLNESVGLGQPQRNLY